ncbi:hypothetical protein STCU_01671 [Strigomonas culicis]|uniref:Uncharacterized protein n=1 Tax=Strigomonas culicis TaxID=28005 RepID=S9VIC7_9TRYP|nr:hypothetical protein STCU_06044 [Strigomonas culicis]EPY34299.1 hypothetical protein STCU_01671 [Strigomonas culicis]|eukprot:EPY26856.1 hypothetical protein STCU_06044 [Strigomonas culicis]
MTTTVVEELPLIRGKNDGAVLKAGAGPNVGPGSYNVDYQTQNTFSRAPFNTTGERRPLYDNDPSVPGPGAYDIDRVPPDERYGVSGVPFVSESDRFAHKRDDAYPGPGSYETTDRWPTKKDPRAHKFTFAPERNMAGVGSDTHSGPGYYEPNYNAATRKKPKATDFGRSCGRRGLDGVNDVPGPGSYDAVNTPHNIYDAKPSSMFVTKSKRSQIGGTETPGPGAYNIGESTERPMPGQHYSAFGSSTTRFGRDSHHRAPGPGDYTSNIAPRRFRHIQNGNGTAPFVSASHRFGNTWAESPGPGSYDGYRMPKHVSYGAETPFQSTVARFGPSTTRVRNPIFDDYNFSQTDPSLRPQQSRVLHRPFINGPISPTLGPEKLQDRDYIVNYEGYVPPGSTRGTLGLAERDSGPRKAASAPGPGTYDGHSAASGQFNNSNWARQPRFRNAGEPTHGPASGRTYYESTFITKSHNVTIGSDTLWTH